MSLLGRPGVLPVTESEHLNVLAFTPDQSPIACTSLLPKKERTKVIALANPLQPLQSSRHLTTRGLKGRAPDDSGSRVGQAFAQTR